MAITTIEQAGRFIKDFERLAHRFDGMALHDNKISDKLFNDLQSGLVAEITELNQPMSDSELITMCNAKRKTYNTLEAACNSASLYKKLMK